MRTGSLLAKAVPVVRDGGRRETGVVPLPWSPVRGGVQLAGLWHLY